MKRIYENLVKLLEEAKKNIVITKNDNLQKLEELQVRFSKELDEYIEAFYKNGNLVKEAIRNRLQLKKFKIGFFRYLSAIKINYLISIPFIGAMIIPSIILHIFLEIYHRICFPLYGIKTLRARDYFVFDRHHLAYLNLLEKIFCIYCSYVNRLIAYTRDIAGLTELYWCPIKHARRVKEAHNQYHLFTDYIEGEEYRKKQKKLREMAKKHGGKELPID